MILPDSSKKRYDAVIEQLYYCTRSMEQRGSMYSRREAVYRKGAVGVVRGRLNKAKPAIDKQASMLLASHLIKFWPDVPPEERDDEVFNQSDAISDAVKVAWDDLDINVLFPMGVLWSLVDGCYFLSLTPQRRTDWDVELRADLIHPRDFGVSREIGRGSWDLDRQQGVAVRSYHTLEELDRWISERPDKKRIMEKFKFVQVDAGERGSRITGIAPGATILQAKPESWPSVTGEGDDSPPQIAVEMIDLRLFDDDLGDYRVFTLSGDVILRERVQAQVGVPNMLPYCKICPDEDPESAWGNSMIDQIAPLQEWYLNRMEGMDEKFRQSLRPPTAAIGLGQGFEEKLAAFRRPGGRMAIPNQNAKIEQFKPEMSDTDFTMMNMIADQLNDQAQLRPGMLGKNEPGVRTEGMAMGLMKMSSAEVLSKSLRIEDNAEDFANLLFHHMRRYYSHKLVDAKGRPFFMSEFPQSVKIRIDGHSSSPLLIEDHKLEAKALFQMGLLTPSRAIRFVSPVMESSILHDLSGDVEMAKMIAMNKVKLEQELKRGGKDKALGEGA